MTSTQFFAVALLVVLCASFADARRPKWHQLTERYSFEQYMIDFTKMYPTPEEQSKRQRHFNLNLREILKHNSEPHSWKKGINHLADLSAEELGRLRGHRGGSLHKSSHASSYTPKPRASALPVTLDYRRQFPPVLTAIKDQGRCGDCWAHAVTEAIESSWAIATGELFALSQQQVTSCTPQAGECFACDGAFASLGYDYVVSAGLTEEYIYPFTSYMGDNGKCRSDPFINAWFRTAVNISGYINVGVNNQDDVVAALNELGPMSIAVDASDWSFYESGVFDGCPYSQNITVDHAVQLIGYGSENGQDYWIVRNSWSAGWGDNGYIHLAKPSTVQCGWNNGATGVWDCYGQGESATACGTCGILSFVQFPTVNAS